MKIVKPLLTTVFLSAINFAALAADNLLQVYEQAKANDPQIKASLAARNAVLETRPQSLAQLLPVVSLTGAKGRVRQDIKNADVGQQGVITYNQSDVAISLIQPVFRQDYMVQLRQSDAVIAQAEAEYAAAEQDLIIRTATAYFNVLTAESNLDFAKAERKAIGRQLDQAKQRFEVGLIAITDVHESQAAFDFARAAVIRIQNNLVNAREALREITGGRLVPIAPLAEELPLDYPDPIDVDAWSDAAEEFNLSVTAARSAVEVARQEIELQRSGHYPTLDVVGSYDFNDTGSGSLGGRKSETGVVELQLNIPIYQGGAVTSRTRQARYGFDEALENLERQLRAATRQTRDAFRGVVSKMSEVRALKQSVFSTQSAVEATEAGFEVGTRTIVDVLQAQQALFRQKAEYAKSRHEYVLNTLLLKQAAGSLSDDDVVRVNTWLQP